MSDTIKSGFEHLKEICNTVNYILLSENCIKERLQDLFEKEAKAKIELPMLMIKHRFGLNRFEYLCLIFAAATAIDKNLDCSSMRAAINIYSFVFGPDETMYRSLANDKPLRYLLDFLEGERFKLKNEVYYYIIDELYLDNSELTVIDVKDKSDKPVLYKRECNNIYSFLKTRKAALIKIYAPIGSGKKTLAMQICTMLNKSTLLVCADETTDKEEKQELINRIVLISVMTNSIPVFSGNAVCFTKEVIKNTKIAFMCMERATDSIQESIKISTYEVVLGAQDKNIIQKMWEYAKGELTLDTSRLSESYKLSIGQIASVAVAANCQKEVGNNDTNDMELVFTQIARLNKSCALARLITPVFGMNSLVIDSKTQEKLFDVLTTLRLRQRVYDKYGYSRLFPYGRGIGILLYGSSGTGKTMAAHAMAKELGLNIMAADLSRIVDKYIGETEKHLNEIFEAAASNNCLLFFDECDSLFSKRTQVSDSHDRNANNQTSHLLQKMEEFGGQVILATNLMENIDDAFKRRLPFIIEFHRPDAMLREKLWRQYIPQEVERKDIDFKFLANTYELSPAIIKWTAFSATIKAVSQDSVLKMEHIFTALKNEYEKTGAMLPKTNFGEEIVLG